MKTHQKYGWMLGLIMLAYLPVDANFSATDCGTCCPDMHFIFDTWNPPYMTTLSMAGQIYIVVIVVLVVLLIWEALIQRSRKTKGEQIIEEHL
jgi:hypothetical protein